MVSLWDDSFWPRIGKAPYEWSGRRNCFVNIFNTHSFLARVLRYTLHRCEGAFSRLPAPLFFPNLCPFAAFTLFFVLPLRPVDKLTARKKKKTEKGRETEENFTNSISTSCSNKCDFKGVVVPTTLTSEYVLTLGEGECKTIVFYYDTIVSPEYPFAPPTHYRSLPI